jgi:hypothetical protein
MNNKLNRDKPEVEKKVKTEYNRCITCRKPCSMSGLCMMQWPEFSSSKIKKVASHSEINLKVAKIKKNIK